MSSSNAGKAPRSMRRSRRWALRLGVALAFLLVLLGALYAGRERILAPWIIGRASTWARDATGLELVVGRIGGDWWSELDLSGVELTGGEPASELTRLAFDRLHARYSLLGLLRGDPDAVRSVELDGAQLDLDFDRPRRAVAPEPAKAPAVFAWPLRLPALIARRASVSLTLAGSRLEVEGAEVASLAPSTSGTLQWDVRAERFASVDPLFGEHGGALSARVGYEAGVFTAPQVEFDGATFARELTCDLRGVLDERVTFSGVIQHYGGDQEFRGAIAEHELALWLATHDLAFGDALRDLQLTPDWSGRASVTGVLHVPLATPLSWNVILSGRADAPAFRERQFDLATFAGSFDAERLELREGALVRGANSLELADFGISLSGRKPGDFLRSLTGAAEVLVLEPRAVLAGASPAALNAADRVRFARLAARFAPEGIAVDAGEVQTDLGGLVVQRGRASFGARDLPWYEGLALDLDLSLDFEDIAPLAALLAQGEAHGALTGTVQLRGAATRPSGKFELAGKALSVRGFELGAVRVEARADREVLEVSKLEIDGALGQASASGKLDYASGVLSDARIDARTSALDVWSGQRAFAALVAVEASVAGSWRAPRARARVQAWNLAYQARSIEKLDAEGSFEGGCARIERLEARVEQVDLAASGSVCAAGDGAWRIGLEHARLAREELDLALESPAEIALSPGQVAVRSLCVAGSAGRATAELSWTDAAQDFSIDASELYPMKLLAPFLPAGVAIEGVQGSLSLHRTAQSLQGDAALHVAELVPYAGSPAASLSFHGQLRERELVISELVLSAPGHYSLDVSGRVPTDPLARAWLSEGPLELYGDANVSDLASLPWEAWGFLSTWGGAARAAFRLEGTSTDLRGVVDATLDVTRTSADAVLERARLNAFQFDGRWTIGEEITLDNARFSVPERATAILGGRLGLRVSPLAWLRARALDWRAAEVDVTTDIEAGDLGFVSGLAQGWLRRTGGALAGKLRVRGTLGEPSLEGSLELARGEVRLANALAPFEKLSAHLEFDGRGVQVVSLAGDYGAAPFEARGTLEFGHEPKLDFHVTGKGLLLAREEGLRLRGDADLDLKGPLSALSLSGGLIIVEGRFSKEFTLLSLPGRSSGRRTRELELPFLRRAPWANIEFDVTVTAAHPVRVETNIARGSVDPRLHLRGNGAAPRLGGSLLIGATRVKLPAAMLEVTSGALTFRGESSLAPDLDITAVTRVRGYDITAQVSGTSLEPELSFTSSPPLSSEELAVLVLTGQLPESALSAQGSTQAAQVVAVYLGRDLLTRWLGVEEDAEDPFSERIEFYRGAEVSQTGIESTEFIFRLTSNPKGKSTLFYLRAENDIYERINFGVKILFRSR